MNVTERRSSLGLASRFFREHFAITRQTHFVAHRSHIAEYISQSRGPGALVFCAKPNA